MRLIDVDELMSRLGFEDTQMERKENVGEIITLEDVDNIPTAYDLDDVLEQLEEELQLANKEKERAARENPSQFDFVRGHALGIAKAIGIVKGRGM